MVFARTVSTELENVCLANLPTQVTIASCAPRTTIMVTSANSIARIFAWKEEVALMDLLEPDCARTVPEIMAVINAILALTDSLERLVNSNVPCPASCTGSAILVSLEVVVSCVTMDTKWKQESVCPQCLMVPLN